MIAATPCDAPLFEGAIRKAAREKGADVVLMKHGLHPETLNNVSFSILVHMSGKPYLFDDLVLYFHSADGYWLVPSRHGPFIALQKDGLRVDFAPPFITSDERVEGVCEAAAQLVRSMRGDQ